MDFEYTFLFNFFMAIGLCPFYIWQREIRVIKNAYIMAIVRFLFINGLFVGLSLSGDLTGVTVEVNFLTSVFFVVIVFVTCLGIQVDFMVKSNRHHLVLIKLNGVGAKVEDLTKAEIPFKWPIIFIGIECGLKLVVFVFAVVRCIFLDTSVEGLLSTTSLCIMFLIIVLQMAYVKLFLLIFERQIAAALKPLATADKFKGEIISFVKLLQDFANVLSALDNHFKYSNLLLLFFYFVLLVILQYFVFYLTFVLQIVEAFIPILLAICFVSLDLGILIEFYDSIQRKIGHFKKLCNKHIETGTGPIGMVKLAVLLFEILL